MDSKWQLRFGQVSDQRLTTPEADLLALSHQAWWVGTNNLSLVKSLLRIGQDLNQRPPPSIGRHCSPETSGNFSSCAHLGLMKLPRNITNFQVNSLSFNKVNNETVSSSFFIVFKKVILCSNWHNIQTKIGHHIFKIYSYFKLKKENWFYVFLVQYACVKIWCAIWKCI